MLTIDQVDSAEELYFIWYLEELIVHGIINSYEYHPMAFCLSNPVYTYGIEEKTVRKKIVKKTIVREVLKGHQYQPDFKIIWNQTIDLSKWVIRYDEKLIRGVKGVFQAKLIDNEIVSYVEIKSGAISPYMNSSAVSYTLNLKWLYKDYNIFAHKIIPIYTHKVKMRQVSTGLFTTTFTPQKYLMTDGGTQRRKLHYEPRTFAQYYHG